MITSITVTSYHASDQTDGWRATDRATAIGMMALCIVICLFLPERLTIDRLNVENLWLFSVLSLSPSAFVASANSVMTRTKFGSSGIILLIEKETQRDVFSEIKRQ